MPRCLIGGCVLVTALYLLINVTFGYAIGRHDLAGLPDAEVERLAENATSRLFGPRVASLMAVIILFGLLASLSAFTLTGPRLIFAMAKDSLLPAAVGRCTRSAPPPSSPPRCKRSSPWPC